VHAAHHVHTFEGQGKRALEAFLTFAGSFVSPFFDPIPGRKNSSAAKYKKNGGKSSQIFRFPQFTFETAHSHSASESNFLISPPQLLTFQLAILFYLLSKCDDNWVFCLL